MARRSVKYNHLEEKVEIVTGDIKEAGSRFALASFDVVTSNPPYMNDAHGIKNPGDAKAIARHEVLCTLDDVVREGTREMCIRDRPSGTHEPAGCPDHVDRQPVPVGAGIIFMSGCIWCTYRKYCPSGTDIRCV